jgi:molybdopterin adenylyltransferase
VKYRAVVITISDKGSKGERQDTSGPRLREMLDRTYDVGEVLIVPDEMDLIAETIKAQTDREGFDLVVTTGGTGVGPRDVTPEATRAVIEKDLPGFSEAMRMESYRITPFALISRAVPRLFRGYADGKLSDYALCAHFAGCLRHQRPVDHHQPSRQPEGGRRVPLFYLEQPAPRIGKSKGRSLGVRDSAAALTPPSPKFLSLLVKLVDTQPEGLLRISSLCA